MQQKQCLYGNLYVTNILKMKKDLKSSSKFSTRKLEEVERCKLKVSKQNIKSRVKIYFLKIKLETGR